MAGRRASAWRSIRSRQGEPTTIEFWHVDQELSLFINGDRVLAFAYDWAPEERL